MESRCCKSICILHAICTYIYMYKFLDIFYTYFLVVNKRLAFITLMYALYYAENVCKRTNLAILPLSSHALKHTFALSFFS